MYNKTFNLNDDEIAAKINARTGEVIELRSKSNNIPEHKEIHFKQGKFVKAYDSAWDYLLSKLSPIELKIVMQMSRLTRMNSNSLAPLSNETTKVELSETFNVDRRKISNIFKKLFKIGVYAEFRFSTVNGIKQYWVLNPYISFKGKTIDKGIADLFREAPLTEYVMDNN